MGVGFRGPLRPPVTVTPTGMSIELHQVEPVTVKQALTALLSDRCDGCEGPKPVRFAFCRHCFVRLHPQIQQELYKEIGKGFERAYAGALLWIETRRRKVDDAENSEPEQGGAL